MNTVEKVFQAEEADKFSLFNCFKDFNHPILVIDNDTTTKECKQEPAPSIYNSTLAKLSKTDHMDNIVENLSYQGAESPSKVFVIVTDLEQHKRRVQDVTNFCHKLCQTANHYNDVSNPPATARLRTMYHFMILLDCSLSQLCQQFPVMSDAWFQSYSTQMQNISKNGSSNSKQDQNALNMAYSAYDSNFTPYPILPSMVTENIFVGARITSENDIVLRGLGVECVVNVTKDLPCLFAKSVLEIGAGGVVNEKKSKDVAVGKSDVVGKGEECGFEYLRVAIDDSLNESILEFSDFVWKWLDKRVNETNKKVLIHCEKGQSRSVSIAVMYVMRQYGMGANDALEKVKRMRSLAKPNPSFMTQLKRLEQGKAGVAESKQDA